MADSHFKSEQSKRIADYIEEKYGIKPDFPWREYPDYGVFRHAGDSKWFALFMNIIPSRLYHRDPAQKSRLPQKLLSMDEIEIVDLKSPSAEIAKLDTQKGIFPAYHMNEKYWISVILEDVLPDEGVMKLIEESFNCVSGNARR